MPRHKSDFENLAKISETYEIKLIAKITSLRYQHAKEDKLTRAPTRNRTSILRLGTNRILLTANMLGDFCPMVRQSLTKAQF